MAMIQDSKTYMPFPFLSQEFISWNHPCAIKH